MRRKFLIFSRKIDDCCNTFFSSFGIDCVNLCSSLTKYFPWAIFLLVLLFFASSTYLIWVCFMKITAITITYYTTACIFTIFCLISLYQATIKDPGSMDKNFTKENIAMSNSSIISEDQMRICNFCNTIKTNRTHHCSKCNKCIINLDHHCVWTNNCVGYKNRKFFILLLFYGSLALIMAGISGFSIFDLIFDEIKAENISFLKFARLWISILLTFSCFGNGLFLLKFCLDNFKNVLNDQTIFDKKFKPYLNERNRGKWRNFKEVFGENLFLVLIPFGHIRNYQFEELTMEFNKDFTNIQMSSFIQ